MFKLFLVVICILVGVVVYYPDGDLDNGVVDLIEEFNDRRATQSEAYLYLSGINVGGGRDVLDAGKLWFYVYRQAEITAEDGQRELSFKSPITRSLALPTDDNPLFCKFTPGNRCLNYAASSQASRQSDLARYSQVTERYRKFISYSEYTTLSQVSVFEITPGYRVLIKGNRLSSLYALDQADKGNQQYAVNYLLEEVALLRRHLEVADTVIFKSVLVKLIANHLDVLAYLYTRLPVEKRSELSALSVEELSMEVPVKREFLLYYNIILNILDLQALFGDENIPDWAWQYFYKRNKTINSNFERFQQNITLSKLATAEFSGADFNFDKPEVNYLNYIGTTLNSLSVSNYSAFISQSHNLNVKISLLNHVAKGASQSINNPYYPQQSEKYQIKGDWLCMDGPLPDQHALRCLYAPETIGRLSAQ